MDIGKAVITTGITIGKFFMIKAHEVKNGGMKVVNMNSIFDCGKPKFIGCTVTETAFDATARHPYRVAIMIVIAAFGSFRSWSPPEFPAPQNKSIFE